MDALATFEPIRRRPAKNGDEQDVFSPVARRVLACLVNHPDAVTKTKTRARRRDRRVVAADLRSLAS
jgi:hypothetical protein